MKRLIVTYFIFGAIIFSACGGMDKTLENTGFTLKGPFISEKEIFFLNPATNSIIKINSESGKVNSFRINAKIYTIIEQLLPSLFIISANDESGEIKLIEYDESGKEKRSVNIGSPFTSFELSEDKEYLIMRHTSKSNEISGKRAAVFFKNEVGILEIKTGILRKTTLNFSIMDRPLIFSDPQGHLMSFLCQEGVIIMDYKNPDKIKYVYLDIDRKSPEIESALFSQTGRYMFLKVKNKDDIYSLSVDNNNEDMLVKVNVPSSPYKGLTYISPVTINNSEDTFIAQYSSPTPKLVMMSAESNTTYQNQIPLDSGSNILDTFEQGKILYTIIVNY
ncbi:MAG: hypothetical protein N3B13_08880, partial [Deltaproteobacteria bacterium]|nr:hypothetical protein [Deltaproteobacteria bacterium]